MIDRIRALLRRLTPSGTIVQQTVKSGVWMSATQLSSRFLQVLMLVILARLLEPRHFGLMGIALLTLSATQKFTEIGLNAALIQQRQENVDDYLDTTWCLEIGRGLLITAVLFVIAPWIATLFGEPDATNLIRMIGLSPLLFGLRNPGVIYFLKDLDFHRNFTYRASGDVAQFVVGVGYALVSPTAWALVFAFVSRDLVRLGLSYLLHDYRPWPLFDVGVARELIDYGKWITGSSIIHFLYSEGDDAFVGWFLSATALGFYQYAYRMGDMASSEVSEVIAGVTFPAYSKLQDDTEQLRSALLQTTRLTAFVTFPIAFGLALVAPSFVPAVLGTEWNPMIPAMQILAIYGLLHSLTRNFGSLWKAVDRPDLMAKLGVVRIVLIALLIWPATARWGFVGTALVVVGVYVFPMLPLDVYVTAKLTDGRSIQFYREYWYPFVAASVMFGSLWYVRGWLSVPPLVEFLLLVPAGVVVYVLSALLIEYRFDWGIGQNVRTLIDGLAS